VRSYFYDVLVDEKKPTFIRPVTGMQVASAAQVSRATVSIVMNGQAEARKLKPETVRRVLQAAEELHYVPDQNALSLHRRHTGVVGLVLLNLKMDWVHLLMQGITEVFDESGHTAFLATHDYNPERNHRELKLALSRRNDAVIAYPVAGSEELYRRYRKAGVPLVLLEDFPEGSTEFDAVVWDAYAAARRAVEHLIATGRRRIAFIGFDWPMHHHNQRYQAYLDAMNEAGLKVREDWIWNPPLDTNGSTSIDRALDRFFTGKKGCPDAIFAVNDGLALPTLAALEERGMRLPEDIALIGMSDLPMDRFPGIGLSSVREPLYEMGVAAARRVLQLIENPRLQPMVIEISQAEVASRRTSCQSNRN